MPTRHERRACAHRAACRAMCSWYGTGLFAVQPASCAALPCLATRAVPSPPHSLFRLNHIHLRTHTRTHNSCPQGHLLRGRARRTCTHTALRCVCTCSTCTHTALRCVCTWDVDVDVDVAVLAAAVEAGAVGHWPRAVQGGMGGVHVNVYTRWDGAHRVGNRGLYKVAGGGAHSVGWGWGGAEGGGGAGGRAGHRVGNGELHKAGGWGQAVCMCVQCVVGWEAGGTACVCMHACVCFMHSAHRACTCTLFVRAHTCVGRMTSRGDGPGWAAARHGMNTHLWHSLLRQGMAGMGAMGHGMLGLARHVPPASPSILPWGAGPDRRLVGRPAGGPFIRHHPRAHGRVVSVCVWGGEGGGGGGSC